MKLIITGATGFIGGEVLHQATLNKEVDSIVVLARRQPAIFSPKIQFIKVEDFLNFSQEVLSVIADADACVWVLGSADISNYEAAKRVHLDFTMAAARAFIEATGGHLSPGKRFRFIYTSGILSIRDQEASAYFLGKFRRLRGEVENQLLALEAESKDKLEVRIARPGAVKKKDVSAIMGVLSAFWNVLPNIKVDALAVAMIDSALHGSKSQVLENADLVAVGNPLIEQKA